MLKRNVTIGYSFILLLAIALLGFWNSYFSRIFNSNYTTEFYIHFHACIALAWILILIAQPLLISKGKIVEHRLVGRISFVVFPVLCISILLLAHHKNASSFPESIKSLFIPFKDLCLLLIAYVSAVVVNKYSRWHYQWMIVTGIVFIEPALVRAISFVANGSGLSFYFTIALIYLLLVFLGIGEWRKGKGISCYPFILVYYLICHYIILFEIDIELWSSFASWFLSLPITNAA
jgi:hypothetical protein